MVFRARDFIFFCLLCFPFSVSAEVAQPEQLIVAGQFHEAIPLLSDQVEAYALNGDIQKQVQTLILLAETQLAIGEFRDAEHSLLSALDITDDSSQTSNHVLLPQIYAALGNLYIALGPPEKAEQFLQKALQSISTDPNVLQLKAVVLNNLGNAYIAAEKEQAAIRSYTQSANLAGKTSDRVLQAKALANSARVHQKKTNSAQSDKALQEAVNLLDGIENSHDKVYLMINLARTDYLLSEKQPTARSFQLLSGADQLAEQLNDHRSRSYALGYIGELYEQDTRYKEALTLTQRAIFLAQLLGEEDARQLLFLWYWQKGRLHEALSDRKQAISAYELAIEQVQSLRYQMQVAYQHNQVSFEEVVQPVYLKLVDLLLQQADAIGEPGGSPKLLFKARNTVEQLKAAELRDYFHDQCVDSLQAKVKDVGQVSPTALVIYPIVLDDRIELLLTLPDGVIKRYTSLVDKAVIEGKIKELRYFLEDKFTYEYRQPARKLYQWLVAPYHAELQKNKIDTLVFVPDGELRTIPMGALYHDGKFLIERYAVAITPSVELTDPRAINNENVNALYGGISESIQGFSALEFVKDEIESIRNLYGGKVLMNEGFKRIALRNSLSNTELNVFHIASHAQFESDVNNSFILTYDGRLSVNELADYIGMFKFRDTPLDLLVLSACETARGDQRSALGLSGIAIKAGARSVLGALWQVDDKASSILMKHFYQQLHNPDNSRAAALQLAQQEMISEKSYQHPRFWSSFILINSWL